MNGRKFENLRQKILSMQFIKSKSCEPAAEFDSIKNLESAIQAAIREIESERREIEREISALKKPTAEPLEMFSFPEPLPQEAKKILARQEKILQRIAAEQSEAEKNFNARKKSFAEKKSELQQKFLRCKKEGR